MEVLDLKRPIEGKKPGVENPLQGEGIELEVRKEETFPGAI